MALSRVTSGHSSSSSITFSGVYAAGDYIIVHALNTSSATIPSVPAGYTSIASASDSTNGLGVVVFGKFATSSAEAAVTATNATAGSWAMYRGVNTTTPYSNAGGQSGSGTTISYSGIVTMTQAGGASTSWAIYTAGLKSSTSQAYNVPPTNTSLTPSTSNFFAGPPPYETAIFDTNAGVASASFNSKTLAATAPWLTKTFELNAAASVASTPTNLFFAMM